MTRAGWARDMGPTAQSYRSIPKVMRIPTLRQGAGEVVSNVAAGGPAVPARWDQELTDTYVAVTAAEAELGTRVAKRSGKCT